MTERWPEREAPLETLKFTVELMQAHMRRSIPAVTGIDGSSSVQSAVEHLDNEAKIATMWRATALLDLVREHGSYLREEGLLSLTDPPIISDALYEAAATVSLNVPEELFDSRCTFSVKEIVAAALRRKR